MVPLAYFRAMAGLPKRLPDDTNNGFKKYLEGYGVDVFLCFFGFGPPEQIASNWFFVGFYVARLLGPHFTPHSIWILMADRGRHWLNAKRSKA